VHFTDTWTELQALDLTRLLAPVALLLLTLFVPGRFVARPATVLVALAMPWLPELGPPPLVAGWALLWLFVAWHAGAAPHGGAAGNAPRPGGGAEPGLVGFAVGLALLALLIAGIARQDLAPEDGRRASWGLLVLGLGLLHLMVRRHAQRALVGFASMGLGLQMLHGAARGAELPNTLPGRALILVATAMTVALATRIARGRECVAGSAWISDAHDLHD
jgi:hypothetical protein